MRMSVKVNLRSTESRLHLKNLQLLSRQKTGAASEEEKKGIDLEEDRHRKDLAATMAQQRRHDQEKYLERVRARFSPLSIIQTGTRNQRAITQSNLTGAFDAIWQYEILGRKFEPVENPLKVGVLES